MSNRLELNGVSAIATDGSEIPCIILREYRVGAGGTIGNAKIYDKIEISRSSGSGQSGEFKVYVWEEKGGEEGGGIMGDLMDKYAQTHLNQKRYPYCGYDIEHDCDYYNLGFKALNWVWIEYKKILDSDKKEITDAQRAAREDNMAKARQARLDRVKHLRTHFN